MTVASMLKASERPKNMNIAKPCRKIVSLIFIVRTYYMTSLETLTFTASIPSPEEKGKRSF